MKQFCTVLKFELNNYFKNKSFVITTFILAFIIAAVVIVPTFIPGLLGEDVKTEEPNASGDIIVEDETDDMENRHLVFALERKQLFRKK